MKKDEKTNFVSPISKKPLVRQGKGLITENQEEFFSVINNVPVLLPENTAPDWRRELIEVILWEYPDEIEKIHQQFEESRPTDPNSVYVEYIGRLLKTKENIIKAFESYASQNTQNWIVGNKRTEITREQKRDFRRFSKKSIGKKRTITKKNGIGSFWDSYRYFGNAVNSDAPNRILELATGAGGGTASAALYMKDGCDLFTVDIGYDCLGNAVGISKYQKKTIIPVCANFWYLPFADGCMDVVCTYCGLDESRENRKTLSEASRVLKGGGRFVVTSRKDALMRQHKVLAPFGFMKEETIELLKSCRMYSSIEDLDEQCADVGLALQKRKEFDRDNGVIFVVSEYIKK